MKMKLLSIIIKAFYVLSIFVTYVNIHISPLYPIELKLDSVKENLSFN